MLPDLEPLAKLSAKIGADPTQVQAAGGNSSMKSDGILWVKASGLWLKDALSSDIFVPVNIDRLLDGYNRELSDPVKPAVVSQLNPQGLRPSIETSLHAYLPHRYVMHTHSVATIANAIQTDWLEILDQSLKGLPWCAVPYVKPGIDLTRGMQKAMQQKRADIVILGNHGLVVAADTIDQLEALLADVEERLKLPITNVQYKAPSNPPDGWRQVSHESCHSLAFDPNLKARACQGSLYPDHVIFLGPGACAIEPKDGVHKLYLHADAGALLPNDAGPSEDEMALCLKLVLERLAPEADLRYLSASEEAALLNWDAEKYRQALAKRN